MKNDIKVRREVRGNYIESWCNGKGCLCVFWNSQINGRAPVMELLLGKVKLKNFCTLNSVENCVTCIRIIQKNFFWNIKKFPLNQCCPGCNATVDGLLTNFLEGTLKISENIRGNVCCEVPFYRNKFFIE